MHYKKILFLFTFLFVGVFSYALTLQDLDQMPTSVEKDYYIWRFITDSNTAPQDAQVAIQEASYINSALAKSYYAKTGIYVKAGTFCKDSECAPPSPTNNTVQAGRYFFTAIKLLKSGNTEQAIINFDYSRGLADKQQDIDRATFWEYLISQNSRYLDMLNDSRDINLYSLLGRDFANRSYPDTITPKLQNVAITGFDITNPIHWVYLKKQLFDPSTNLDKLAEEYQYTQTMPQYTYIRAYASKHKEIYYPLPFRDIMEDLSIQRQALIYSIARQESRFIPASISRSFALGMMQMMPFLVNHIANERRDNTTLEDMFDPKKSIDYANYHLNYLTKYLHHPLFVAYAYNAGIGFTRGLLRRNDMFKTGGSYEPYLSIESVENSEAREYGKKVLTNYVIYMNKLGVSTRMYDMIKVLNDGRKIDEFRN